MQNSLYLLSKNLKRIMDERELTISQVSKLTGISTKYLKKIENQTAVYIKLCHLEKLCVGLKTDVKTLFEL